MICKRVFDIVLGIVLLVVFTPFLLATGLRAILKKDRPVFYISERMTDIDTPFNLIKFRTMRPPVQGDGNAGVSGGDKEHRITRFGRFLRRYRIDEIPQIFNVIAGSMSFVGPRPPLRRYTEQFPEIYRQVLQNRPGITGLASIIFHRHEARLLCTAQTPQETEDIYVRRCIPRKATLDLIYQRNASLKLDVYILYLTAAKLAPLPGRRANRIRRS